MSKLNMNKSEELKNSEEIKKFLIDKFNLDNMKDIIQLKSGARLEIGKLNFKESQHLLTDILKEIDNLNIVGQDEIFNLIKKVTLSPYISLNIKSGLQPALNKTKYNGELLEICMEKNDRKFQADYLIIVYEVLIYNIAPFFCQIHLEFTPILKILKTI